MTSESLNNGMTDGKAAQGAYLPLPKAFPQPPRQTRPSAYKPAARAKVPGLPERYVLEIDGWNRKMSAVLAHLRHACNLLEMAEQKINDQQRRIAMLEALATTDELTGLKNRRGFMDAFDREIEGCNRGLNKGGLLMMIDLDNFKTINDTYGHQAGDAILRLVSRTMAHEVRKMDTVGRLGGDEFIILLANTTKNAAAERAQSITWQLNNLSLAWDGDLIPVHASVGLKDFGPGDQIDDIIHAADGTLYANKSARKMSGFFQPVEGEPQEQCL